jgi:hypothetical protein
MIRAIRPHNLGTILHLAGMKVGEQRNVGAIVAYAEEWGADVPVVLAAFGFLRDQYRSEWVDMLCPERNRRSAAPIIDVNPELRAAAYLACCAFGGQLMIPYDLGEVRLKQRIRDVWR